MNDDRLGEIKTRASVATPGPWRPVDLRHQKGGQIRIFGGKGAGLLANVLRSGPQPGTDAWFIAEARDDVAWLIGEVERLRSAARRCVCEPTVKTEAPSVPATTLAGTVAEQAAHVYDACAEIIVRNGGGDQWEVRDGGGGPLVATVPATVLRYLDENFDLPVQMDDGSPFCG